MKSELPRIFCEGVLRCIISTLSLTVRRIVIVRVLVHCNKFRVTVQHRTNYWRAAKVVSVAIKALWMTMAVSISLHSVSVQDFKRIESRQDVSALVNAQLVHQCSCDIIRPASVAASSCLNEPVMMFLSTVL